MDQILKTAQLLNYKARKILVNKKDLEQVINILFHEVLFPICNKNPRVERNLITVYHILVDNISTIMEKGQAEMISTSFIIQLPFLQERLYQDAKNYIKNDPASNSIEEIILAYPGFFAMAVHRIAHELHKLNVAIIPRVFSEYAHSKVGIDIHPAAQIGEMCYIDHGTGIVIGETCKIGNNVKIYQGVTLGALFVSKQSKDLKRHPTIEDNVVIYANATILGGDTIIGHDSIIGGNVWLTDSIKPNSIVYHESKINIKNNINPTTQV